jgi:hypothetical protein
MSKIVISFIIIISLTNICYLNEAAAFAAIGEIFHRDIIPGWNNRRP